MVEVHTFAVQKSLQLSRRVLQGVPAQDLQEKKEDLVRPVWQRHVQGTKLFPPLLLTHFEPTNQNKTGARQGVPLWLPPAVGNS